ncbi:hypothetical protein RHMOL_Rhmol13G0019300 [Rhododendron molle]|uniref:Uncharacterized protein n=1 Tax=Rhododendron molle TaxID=49168 RepID=A0ACC0L3B3_RHOML|nr:hypothetical protein RHMOL_Rhmol13G0019300 [Rhododendron molle]
MAPKNMLLKDVDTRSWNWTCQVLVLEQAILHLTKASRPYKRFILQDIKLQVLPQETRPFIYAKSFFARGSRTTNMVTIKALPDNNSNPSAMIRESQPPKELMTKIANLPTMVDTQFYFVACHKCKRGTDAYDDDEMWWNQCNQQLPPMATLKFEIEVTDSTGSITATIYDTEAENIFNVTVAEIKEICPDGQLTPIVKQKLSTPTWCDINLKVYNYNFGGISQCKFTVKSLYPAAPKLKDQILPLPTLTLPSKSQK